ncbi:response regulator transcription factor [Solimonas terrae]|uniref:Response regulator transcription factor n=1 Tax=Solimonas terrae TaxID=1396819 RepID=A0A6M2BU57_9GAMM|nr:response regulator transcription factor [Solimonas terrae]NGY05477.1 response regulator transcription factor [Solimonas terrae]
MNRGLVVEDQPALTRWLGETLADAFPGVEVRTADTLASARASITSQAPDIALVDLGLPDGSGIDLIAELAASHPGCHCIVTTIYADDQHLFPALRAGAAGYLLKDQPRDRTVAALRGIAAGEPPLSASIARRLLRVFGDEKTARATAEAPKLTPRERETLTLIAKGFKIAEVAETLGVTRNTAHEFVKNVYRKLKIGCRAEAAVEATRLGLINPHL